MTFLHLASLQSNFYSIYLNQLSPEDSAVKPKKSKETYHKKKSPFLPLFSKGDEIRAILYTYKICDEKGNCLLNFDKKKFLTLNSENQEDRKVLNRIKDYLNQTRWLFIQLPEELKKYPKILQAFRIPIHLTHLFSHLIEYASSQKPDTPIIPITEIELVGKTLLELLGDYLFYKASLEMFQVIEEKEPGLIKSWFEHEEIQPQFRQKGSDDDFRSYAAGDLSYFQKLTNETLDYLTQPISISADEHPLYLSHLTKINPYYKQLKDNADIKRACLKEYGGVTKRNDIFKGKDEYSVLGLRTSGKQKDIDLIYVNDFKKNHRFDKDSLKAPLIKAFLTGKENNPFSLELDCAPFSDFRYVVAKLTKKCSVFDRSLIDEDHLPAFLASATCLGECLDDLDSTSIISVEEEIFIKFLNHKKAFLAEKASKRKKNFNKPIDESDSYYIYSTLKNYLRKHHQEQPLIAFVLTFNACQLFSSYSSLPAKELTQQLTHLWELMHKKKLIAFDEQLPENAFYTHLKNALVLERRPFLEVASWMQLCTFIFSPQSITTHNNRPAFSIRIPHSKQPLYFLLSFEPMKALQTLSDCLYKGYNTSSFLDFFHYFAPNKITKDVYPSPLSKDLEHLDLDLAKMTDFAQAWIEHFDPFISYLGTQLYLATPNRSYDISTVHSIFCQLPKVLSVVDLPFKLTLLGNIKSLLSSSIQHGPFIQAITCFEKQLGGKDSKIFCNWIDILTRSCHPPLISCAYQSFKEQIQKGQIDKAIGLKVLNGLRPYYPNQAVHVLKILHQHRIKRQKLLTFEEQVRCLILICQDYQKQMQSIPIDGIVLHSILEELIELKGDQLTKFNCMLNQIHKETEFSDSLIFLIHYLHQQPHQAHLGDELLIKASHKEKIPSSLLCETWLQRLEQLLEHSKNKPCISAIFFKFANQEGFLKTTEESKERLQKFEIKLIIALQKSSDPLEKELLDHLLNETIEPKFTKTTSQVLIQSIKKAFKANKIDYSTLQWLEKCIQISLPHYSEKIRELIILCLKQVIQSSDPILLEAELILQIDQLLLRCKDKDLFCSKESKELLFSYVKISLSTSYKPRFPSIWTVFEKLILPLSESPISLNNQQILEEILKQARHFSLLPLESLRTWIQLNQLALLDCLQAAECHQASLDFLFDLDYCQIKKEKTIHYSLQACHQLIKKPNPPFNLILKALNREPFDELKQALTKTHLPFLQKVVTHLLDSGKEQNAIEALKWLELCLEYRSLNQPEPESLNFLILDCCSALIQSKRSVEAFKLLLHYGNTSKDKLIRPYWLEIIAGLQKMAYPKLTEDVLLKRPIQDLFKSDLSPLKIWAEKEVGQLTLKASSSNLKLALQLLEDYKIMEGELWTFMWKALKEIQDKELISQTWFKFKEFEEQIEGSVLVLVHCWIALFEALETVRDPKILYYLLGDEDHFKKVFPTNSNTLIKLKIEAYRLILVGSIHQLSTEQFSIHLFQTILIRKQAIKNEFLENNPSCHSSDLESDLAFLHREVNATLVKHLAISSNSVYLSLIPNLFINLLTLLTKQTDLMALLLPLEQLVASYMKSNSNFNLFLSENKTSEVPILDLNSDINPLLQQALYSFFPETPIFSKQDTLKRNKTFINVLLHLSKPSPSTLEKNKIALKILYTLLAHAQPEQLNDLKDCFVSLIDAGLNYIDNEVFDLIEDCLDKGIPILPFSSEKKSSLCGRYLAKHLEILITFCYINFQPSEAINSLNKVRNQIDQAMALYVKWVPHLFFDSQLLEKVIKYITELCIYNGSSHSKAWQDENKFKTHVFDILNVRSKAVQNAKHSEYEKCLNQYIPWLIKSWFSLPLRHDFIFSSFYRVIQQLIKNKKPEQEVLYLIRQFIYLYPPSLIPDSKHFTLSKKITIQADKAGYFKHNSDLLFEYYLYHETLEGKFIFSEKLDEFIRQLSLAATSGITMDNQVNQSINYYSYQKAKCGKFRFKDKKEIILKVWNSILEHADLESLYRAILDLNYFYPCLIEEKDGKTLLSLNKKILNILQKDNKKGLFFQIINNKFLLDYLHQAIIPKKSLEQWTNYERTLSWDMLKQLFKLVFNCAKNFSTKEQENVQIHYIKLTLSILHTLFQSQAFNKSYAEYMQLIEDTMPVIQQLVARDMEFDSFRTLISQSKDFSLSTRLVQLIANISSSFKNSEVRKATQRKTFLKWLKLLQTASTNPSKPFPGKVKEHTIISLSEAIQQGFFNDQTEEAVRAWNEAKEWIKKENDTYLDFNMEIIEIEFFSTLYKEKIAYFEKLRHLILKFPEDVFILIGYDFEAPIRLLELIIKKFSSITEEERTVQYELFCLFLKNFQETLESKQVNLQIEIENGYKNEEMDWPSYLKDMTISDKAKSVCLLFIGKTIDYGIFDENWKGAEDIFKQAIQWISTHSHPSTLAVVSLLDLLFHAPSRFKQDPHNYYKILTNLIPQLKAVFFNLDFNPSCCLLKALAYCPLSMDPSYKRKKAEVFILWLQALYDSPEDIKELKTFRTHVIHLFKDACDLNILDSSSLRHASKLTEGVNIDPDLREVAELYSRAKNLAEKFSRDEDELDL
jgi:hypothetical protein